MKREIKDAYLYFLFGMFMDLISTIIGVSLYDIREANPIGLLGCIIINIGCAFIIYKILDTDKPIEYWKLYLIVSILYIVGTLKLLTGILNFIFM